MDLKDAIVELKKFQQFVASKPPTRAGDQYLHAAEVVLEEAVLLAMVTQERDELAAVVQEIQNGGDNPDLWGILVRERDELLAKVERLREERDFYKVRCEALQKVQVRFRDPEREILCGLLANGPPSVAVEESDDSVRICTCEGLGHSEECPIRRGELPY